MLMEKKKEKGEHIDVEAVVSRSSTGWIVRESLSVKHEEKKKKKKKKK
jgi:hypothetical protein